MDVDEYLKRRRLTRKPSLEATQMAENFEILCQDAAGLKFRIIRSIASDTQLVPFRGSDYVIFDETLLEYFSAGFPLMTAPISSSLSPVLAATSTSLLMMSRALFERGWEPEALILLLYSKQMARQVTGLEEAGKFCAQAAGLFLFSHELGHALQKLKHEAVTSVATEVARLHNESLVQPKASPEARKQAEEWISRSGTLLPAAEVYMPKSNDALEEQVMSITEKDPDLLREALAEATCDVYAASRLAQAWSPDTQPAAAAIWGMLSATGCWLILRVLRKVWGLSDYYVQVAGEFEQQMSTPGFGESDITRIKYAAAQEVVGKSNQHLASDMVRWDVLMRWLNSAVSDLHCVPDEKSGSELIYRVRHAEIASLNSFTAIISVIDDDWFQILNMEAAELLQHCRLREVIRRCFLSCDDWVEHDDDPEVEATASWCRSNCRGLDRWIVERAFSPQPGQPG